MEEDKLSIKHTETKQLLTDISSEVDLGKNDDKFSDMTSITSNNSGFDLNDNYPPEIPIKKQNSVDTMIDAKKMYQDFVKVCLKVKFEKLHNSHKGREIPEKILFKESILQGIHENDWYSFVLSELQSPHKYNQHLGQLSNRKIKLQKNVG